MWIDFGLSDEGDLVLGEQLTDTEGNLLYHDPTKLGSYTTEPNENTIPIRDIGIRYGDEAEIQAIAARLRTENPDWVLHDGIGADLSDLIGEPNTRETAELGKEKIIQSLTYEGSWREEELDVRAVPYSQESILFVVKLLKEGRNYLRYPLLFNLEVGLVDIHEEERE